MCVSIFILYKHLFILCFLVQSPHDLLHIMNYLIISVLLILSALFSGLTLGLLSLDKNELNRKISLGDKKAKKVFSVRKNGNLLLCTLLLGNVGVNSAIAIYLGDIANGLVAGITATGLIVILGEILPQAIFSRYALDIGAKTAWFVKILIVILFPICFPIAWMLNKVLGEEIPTVYSKKELMKIIEEHEDSHHSDLDEDEERIIKGALSFSEKTAEDILTPRSILYLLEESEILTKTKLLAIKKNAYSRVPVYKKDKDNIVGVLLVKNLIGISPLKKVRSIYTKIMPATFNQDTRLDHLLSYFLKSKNHLVLIKNNFDLIVGIVTLEDVIEEILNVEIMDESDIEHADITITD